MIQKFWSFHFSNPDQPICLPAKWNHPPPLPLMPLGSHHPEGGKSVFRVGQGKSVATKFSQAVHHASSESSSYLDRSSLGSLDIDIGFF